MDEIGTVKSIDGITAKVVIARGKSCCENCEKDVCDIPEDGIETEAINQAGAKVGQKVKVVMKTYTFFKGAMILYVLPLFALFSGAILGKLYLPAYINDLDSELLAAIGSFLLFFISLILVKFLSGRMNKKTEYKSVIEKVIQ